MQSSSAAGITVINTCTNDDNDIDIDIDKFKNDLQEAKKDYSMPLRYIARSSADRGDQRGGYNMVDKQFQLGLYDSVIDKLRIDAQRLWVNERGQAM